MKRLFVICTLLTAFGLFAYAQSKQFLYVEFSPSDARLEINGQVKETVGGTYEELVPLGTYQYVISKEGYRSRTGTININDPRNTKTLNITLKKVEGYLSLQNLPDSKCDIYIDNKPIEYSPGKMLTVASGEHCLSIKNPLYRPVKKYFYISDEETTTINLDMVQTHVDVKLETDVNSNIYVNGKYKGRGSCIATLALSRKYKLESSKKYHKNQSIKYQALLEDSQKTITIPEPLPIYGSLEVNSSHKATLFVDGQSVGTTPRLIQELIIGEHSLYLQSDKYQTPEQQIQISKGKKSTAFFNIPQGSLTLTSTPTKASVFIDDTYVGMTPMHIPEIVVNEHDVTVEFNITSAKGDKIRHTKTINIEEGVENVMAFSIEEAAGSLSVTSYPSGASVYIDNIEVGETPGTFLLPIGSHTVIVTDPKHIFHTFDTNILPNKEQKVSLSTLNIQTEVPDPTICIDNVPILSAGKVFIPAGEHTVKISTNECKAYTRLINLNEGEVKELSLNVGEVSFTLSSSHKAQIFIDGQEVSTRPNKYLLPLGIHTIKVISEGFDDTEQMIITKNYVEVIPITFVNDSIVINLRNSSDDDEVLEIGGYIEEVEEEVVGEEAIPFQLVEEKPSFNGGDANEFSKWVNSRLVYPEIAKENGVQGRVTLQFTVEKDGSVTKVRVLRGVDPSLDKEAIRVVSSSPKWKPGKQRDRAVPVTYTFPVIFQLR